MTTAPASTAGSSSPETDESLEREFSWFYFDKTGKMLTDEVDKKIDGAYYTFEDGRMQTGWVLTEESAAKDGSVAGYQYYGGGRKESLRLADHRGSRRHRRGG